MKNIFTLLAFVAFTATAAFAQPDTAQKVVSNRHNATAQLDKPYVIMISVDGFRWDYAQKHNAVHLQQFGDQGVHAASMVPSFPSITFPNHYTMVTGLYPSHHGLVMNGFYDRDSKSWYVNKGKTVVQGKWYGGTPLWVLAEKQNMLSASFYWVGSEANIQNTYPTYYYKYNEAIAIHDRIGTVVNWLKQPAETRPHFISFYFPQVDHAGHTFSPDSKQTGEAVRMVDSAIYELTKAVATTGLKVNYIVVSDHGMTSLDTLNVLKTPAIAKDTSKFYRADEGVLMQLYARNKADIPSAYADIKAEAKDYDVYLRDNMPAYLHYGTADDRYNRIGDIILMPHWPKVFNPNNRNMHPGAHGYDPYKVKDMQAVFYAWGPDFKTNVTIPAFKNIDLYPMVARLLGLNITEPVDGTNALAKEVLKK